MSFDVSKACPGPATGFWDRNGDGFTTIGDLWKLLGDLLRAPGDWLFGVAIDKDGKAARFLELGCDNLGGTASLLLSIFLYSVVLSMPFVFGPQR